MYGDPQYTPQDAQRVFLEGLERAGQFPEWQVTQAARAVDIYPKFGSSGNYEKREKRENGLIPDG